MICCEHRAGRNLPGRLPFFPEPYPDESFYSVLCRYHVWSGNVSDGYTIRQLFGCNCSIASTLLTPFHLEMMRYWVPESQNIRAEAMLSDNTAFTVYALSAFPSEIACMRDACTGQNTTGSRLRHMQSRLAHHTGRLRFCPECAAEQIKIYGEPYWQVFFQLDDVEYCPWHKIRVRNTPISYKDIRSRFYPASLILDSQSSTSGETETAWDDLFSTERDFFINLSQNIVWILHNGLQYGGAHNLCASYARIAEANGLDPNWYFIHKREIKQVLDLFSHNHMLYEYVEANNSLLHGSDTIFVSNLKVCSHILLMTALCGHPEVFYNGA